MDKAKRTKDKSKVVLERRWHTETPKGQRKTKKYITASQLRELIAKQLGPKLDRRFAFYVADSNYFCTPMEDAHEILMASAVDRNKWVSERFDCDDFAHVLKSHFAEAAYKDGKRRAAHCFGVVWGSLPTPHAINWMVNSDLKLRFVEPQTDRIFLPRKTDKEIYFMLV